MKLLTKITEWIPPKVNHRRRKMVNNPVWEFYRVGKKRADGSRPANLIGSHRGTYQNAKNAAKVLSQANHNIKIDIQLKEERPKFLRGITATTK